MTDLKITNLSTQLILSEGDSHAAQECKPSFSMGMRDLRDDTPRYFFPQDPTAHNSNYLRFFKGTHDSLLDLRRSEKNCPAVSHKNLETGLRFTLETEWAPTQINSWMETRLPDDLPFTPMGYIIPYPLIMMSYRPLRGK